MKRFLNWLRGLFGRRKSTRLRIHPASLFVMTEDGVILEGVTNFSVAYEPGGGRTVNIEIVEPANVDRITIRMDHGGPPRKIKARPVLVE